MLDKIRIRGGKPLFGEVYISGAKNAALPIIAACLASNDTVVLSNVPNLHDIESMIELLEDLGCNVEFKRRDYTVGHELVIDASKVNKTLAEYDIVRKMRASILVLGPLLARFYDAKVSLPGGCAIGARPVDMHVDALKRMGAEITLEDGYIHAKSNGRLKGADIYFDKISVGATENIVIAASLAEGKTTIHNAAQEPEIEDLCNMLNSLGAKISGIGTQKIVIDGVETLGGGSHMLISDRIEAGTYAIAAAITKGEIVLKNCNYDHLLALWEYMRKAGVSVEQVGSDVKVSMSGVDKINSLHIKTAPYPYFPTDLQAQMMTLLTIADGTSQVSETIFENRFMHVPELMRMGANITLNDNVATIEGVDELKNAQVMATDLRASVSLVLASLAAEGESTVNRVYHLDRGYEAVEEKLRACGADIERVKG